MKNENSMETYDTKPKPDYMTLFLLIMGFILLLFGLGFWNMLLGFVGVMCIVLGMLKTLKNRAIKK